MTRGNVIHLLEKAVEIGKSIWADFGSGDGVFTLALRELAGPDVEIYSVDRDTRRLEEQKNSFEKQFRDAHIHFIEADFTEPLNLPPLDAILMSYSLHYIEHQEAFLKRMRGYLKPSGKLVIVEYETETGNPFVPYPVSWKKLEHLLHASGFEKPERLVTTHSGYFRQSYSAQASIKATQLY